MGEYYYCKGNSGFVKDCPRCGNTFYGGKTQEIAERVLSTYFAADKATTDGFYGTCRECVAKANQARRGGRVCDPEAMLIAQDNKCGICERPINLRRKAYEKAPAYVDHDHETNEVRGLLCHRCNSLLGVIEDREWVKKAEAYLEKYK